MRDLRADERVSVELREMYRRMGYMPYKVSQFEEYDLYMRNKRFLASEHVLSFSDMDGKLMALKPDVTLSIIKNTRHMPGCVQKVYYNENVYRISGSTRSFKEIMQTGLECIGDVDLYCLCEVISLAARSLKAIDTSYVLDISHMGVVSALVDALGLDREQRAGMLACIGEKNADGARKLCPGMDIRGIQALIAAHGPAPEVIRALRPWCEQGDARDALDELERVTELLAANGCDGVQVDFSIVNDMNYYNGIVFMGYIGGVPCSVLSGGQYDKLMQRMGRPSKAVGFAIYMDLLDRLNDGDRPYDVDTVLLYDDTSDIAALTQRVRALTDAGHSVVAQKAVPDKLRYRQLLRFGEEDAAHGE